MAYDNAFYGLYLDYLMEPCVRNAHDKVFKIALLNPAFQNVIDFGCGTSEFYNFAKPEFYIGIDVNAELLLENNRNNESFNKLIIQSNYFEDLEGIAERLREQEPAGFVSLFSAEIMAPVNEKYSLYNKIFKLFPSIKAGKRVLLHQQTRH